MDTVSWALSLKDKVSPVGKRVEASLRKVGAAAKWLGEKGLKLAAKGVDKLRDKVNESAPKLAKWAAIGALAAGVGLAYAGTKLAVDAQKFKDSTLIATRALLKSDQLAGTAYKRMLDFANYFGGDPTEAMEKFNHVLSTGFSAADAEKLLQAFGDLKLVTPNINIDSLADAFGNIRKKGKLELADFEAAVSAGGLNLTLAYEAIGKKIGKNAKQVEFLIGSGRVNAKVGLVGLLDAINQRTNSKQVGDRLAEYANTATGLVERLKNLPQQYMLRLTADNSPIKGTLSKLLGYLDPDSPNGKKIIGALNGAFVKIGDAIAKWATPENIDKFANLITKFIDKAPKFIGGMLKMADAVMTVVDAVIDLPENLKFLWKEFQSGYSILDEIGMRLFAIVGAPIAMALSIRRWGTIVWEGAKTVWKYLTDLGDKALTWGANIADGIWEGLKKSWKGLIEKFKGLVDLLPEAVKKALGIASPSKVFDREIGRFLLPGLVSGVEATAPAANAEIASAIDAGRMAAAGAMSSVSNVANTNATTSSSSRTSVRIDQVNFGSGDRQEQRSQMRDFVGVLERAALG